MNMTLFIQEYNTNRRPHAICIPHPAQGHINPMTKLAKILHSKGFHITFVHTEYNYKRLLKASAGEHRDYSSTFQLETIPDGLPPSDADVTQDIPLLCDSTAKNCLGPFRELVGRINENPEVPPITCIVSDGALSFTLEVARELGIPDVLFWTNGAAGVMAYLHYAQLVEKGYTPLKDSSYLTNGYLDTVIDWIPGLEGIRLKELPTFIRTTDPNDIMLNFAINQVGKVHEASALILNTFDDLESEILKELSLMVPNIYTIGPLHLLENQIPEDDPVKSVKSNLWKEESSCIEWLDTKKPDSVVYVNFGSVTVMTAEQLREFAIGLANTKINFLWIIRPDLILGEAAILSPEFIEDTKERGLLESWCPQEKVLKHSSVGGFLTHCGWNSTLESISFGVPMLSWPFFAEQQTNSWYCTKHLGIAMETITTDPKKDEVEKLINELMVGKEGQKLREKAAEWKKLAEEAFTAPSGSSYDNLEKLINNMLLPNNNLERAK